MTSPVDIDFEVDPRTWRTGRRRGTLLLMPALRTVSFSPDPDTLEAGEPADPHGLRWYVETLSAILEPLNVAAVTTQSS